MHASSHKLAAALAGRLNEVVPVPCRVYAEGYDVGVDARDMPIGGSSASFIVDEDDDRTLGEKIETAVRAVLSGVQDCISEFLTEQWPSIDGRGMAMPGARSDEERVYLWYGENEGAPVISMPPIRIADIAGT